MKLACVYISAQHFHETVAFYEQLLEQVGKPENRGAFTIVLCVYFHAVLVFQFDRPGGKRIGDYRAL